MKELNFTLNKVFSVPFKTGKEKCHRDWKITTQNASTLDRVLEKSLSIKSIIWVTLNWPHRFTICLIPWMFSFRSAFDSRRHFQLKLKFIYVFNKEESGMESMTSLSILMCIFLSFVKIIKWILFDSNSNQKLSDYYCVNY